MAITQTPPTLCSVSFPVIWLASIADPAVEYAQVDVYINGALSRSYNQSPYIALLSITFRIDIKEFCEGALNSPEYTTPQTLKKDYLSTYFGTATDQMITARIDVTYYKLSGGVYVVAGTDTTTDIYVCAAQAQQQDAQTLFYFNPDNYASATINPLTYRTTERMGGERSQDLVEISKLTGSYFVSAIRNQTVDAFQIRLYDDFGSVISVATKFLTPCTGLYDVHTVNIAPQALAGITWDATFGGFNPLTQDYKYLECIWLKLTAPPNPAIFYQRFRARVTPNDCMKNGFLVFWQNPLGGFESEVFELNHVLGLEVSSDSAQTAGFYNVFEPVVADRYDATRRGKIRRNVSAVRTFTFNTPLVQNLYLASIYASLLSSARVYISEYNIRDQIAGNWAHKIVPAVVRSSSFQYSNRNQTPTGITVTLELAHSAQILE